MKNTFGQSVTLTLFGESHGPAVGAVLDGLAPGLPVDEEFLRRQLARRRPATAMDTPRHEPDNYQILSGVWQGRTTGTPLTIVIPNENTRSGDYTYGLARPSHADYAAYCKYHGFEDWRGGGHFSGRVTAPLVAAGAILLTVLRAAGVAVGTHILRCGEAWDRPFADAAADIAALGEAAFPALDPAAGEAISREILAARDAHDSVGGITQTAVCGLPAGVGEPWFDSVESELAHLMFAIPACKGIEFGAGFGFAAMHGSEANDPFTMRDGKIATATNKNGGINGGITNGMPIVFRTVLKPTPSIYKRQHTVDYIGKTDAELQIKGRHDPCIVPRAAVVQNSLTAFGLLDLLTVRYGTLAQKHGFPKV